MSFLRIQNPDKHNQIVADYVAGVNRENVNVQEDVQKNNEEPYADSRIQFLPGDINSLRTKLDYLLAEYRAGNTSATRNQIVAIADELLQRKQLSQAKYNTINHFIRIQKEEEKQNATGDSIKGC